MTQLSLVSVREWHRVQPGPGADLSLGHLPVTSTLGDLATYWQVVLLMVRPAAMSVMKSAFGLNNLITGENNSAIPRHCPVHV